MVNKKKFEEKRKLLQLENENKELKKRLNDIENKKKNKATKKQSHPVHICEECRVGEVEEIEGGPYIILICSECNNRRCIKKVQFGNKKKV